MTEIKRRSLIKAIGLAAGAVVTGSLPALAASSDKQAGGEKKPVLQVAHITDVHIKAGDNAPGRFKKCLNHIIGHHKPDFPERRRFCE